MQQEPVDDCFTYSFALVFGKDGHVLDVEILHPITDKAQLAQPASIRSVPPPSLGSVGSSRRLNEAAAWEAAHAP